MTDNTTVVTGFKIIEKKLNAYSNIKQNPSMPLSEAVYIHLPEIEFHPVCENENFSMSSFRVV